MPAIAHPQTGHNVKKTEPRPHSEPAKESDDEDSFEGFQGPFQTPAAGNEYLDEIE